MNLNDRQKKAVQHVNGPLLILAGAGSGKTRVLTQRIANLIENHQVQPWEILAITFTNKAAAEMRERMANDVGEDVLKNMWISTFHSMCVRILRRFGESIGYTKYFTIYDSAEQKITIKDVMKEMNINEKEFQVGAVFSHISSKKNQFILPRQALKESEGNFREHIIAKIYDAYQDKLYENNVMDFDDLLVNVCILFNNHPDVLSFYQNKFKYILVDEYQDTNCVQYELIRQLADKHKNLCVVGDDDQSIYGWRGADISNILEFEKDFENTTIIKLEQNYRSTKNILEAANAVVKNNENRKPKVLFTDNETGEQIELYVVKNEYREADVIAAQISKDLSEYRRDYKDFAILYRTNAQSRVLEEKMIQSSIPYRMLGGVRFYERKEIKDLVSYLKIIVNAQDDVAARRIINIPKRGIGAASIDKIQQAANDYQVNFYEVAKNIRQFGILGKTATEKVSVFANLIEELKELAQEENILALLQAIIVKTDYNNFLKETEPEDAADRILNVREFVSKAAAYVQSNEEANLNNFLEEITLVADVDNYDQNSNAVVLMTLHSSKGLEFPVVFMPGLEEGLFPSHMSASDEDKTKLEEERRLCYVGITRAREKLYILQAEERMTYGQIKAVEPSRFIAELPAEVIRINKVFASKKYAKKNNYEPTKKSDIEFKIWNPHKKMESTIIEDFVTGDIVMHRMFGKGTVIEKMKKKEDIFVTIKFESGEFKKLNTKFAKLQKV
ncbi:ATP-dependent helicase [Candidatus Epulonipiscium viviparus]|uniref:ATP-dependent helicase n=1 Tax=Candidatus Epulonipiscium viviparus TaxID=420336 RepID=UPI00273808AD|nr:UvrD-helicase domain-containing protein [Candidatus Epulopiscium viviparus]